MDKLIRYLKPNFKNHPANWGVVALVFCMAFIASDSVFAQSVDGPGGHESYQEGYIWWRGSQSQTAHTAASFCQQYAFHSGTYAHNVVYPYNGNPNNARCERRLESNGYTSNFTIWRGACTENALQQHSGDACETQYVPPTPECTQGEQKELVRELSPPRNLGDPLEIVINRGSDGGNLTFVKDGCIYTRSKDAQTEITSFRPLDKEIPGTYETAVWTATGETTEPGHNTAPAYEEGDEDAPETTEELSDLTSDSSLTQTDPAVSQVGDETITEQTAIETETQGKGTVISEQSDTITVDYSEGIAKTVTTTTRVIEHADGSTTEEVTTETAFTQKDNEKAILDKNTGEWTVIPGWTGGTTETTTTTTTKDAQGNVTGETSSTTQTGTNNGTGDQNQPPSGYCQQDPSAPQCGQQEEEEGEPDTPPGEGLYQSGDLTYESVINNFKDSITGSGIYGAATGFFDISISAGSCPVWSADVPMIGTIVMDHFCSPIMDTAWPIVYAVLLLVGGFLAYRIAIL